MYIRLRSVMIKWNGCFWSAPSSFRPLLPMSIALGNPSILCWAKPSSSARWFTLELTVVGVLITASLVFCRPGLNYRMVCEQVSHHPPVSAYDADSDHWHFYGTLQPKIKCWGNSLEVVPNNTATLHLKTYTIILVISTKVLDKMLKIYFSLTQNG